MSAIALCRCGRPATWGVVRQPWGFACAVTGDTRAPLYLCEQCANAKADEWNAPLDPAPTRVLR